MCYQMPRPTPLPTVDPASLLVIHDVQFTDKNGSRPLPDLKTSPKVLAFFRALVAARPSSSRS